MIDAVETRRTAQLLARLSIARGSRSRFSPTQSRGATKQIIRAAIVLVLLSSSVKAAPVAVDTVVRERIGAALPAELGVVDVFLPSSLASLATEADRVTVEMPRNLRAGRLSAKVIVRGRMGVFVPFSVGKRAEVAVIRKRVLAGVAITADDVSIEYRASSALNPAVPSTILGSTAQRELAVGTVVAKGDVVLAPQLPRGTQVTVEMRRGRVRVRGTATLETAARSGEAVTARLSHTRTIVRGTLHQQTLVVGDAP
jgi:flagella basal body P-ring formation protein FlgA